MNDHEVVGEYSAPKNSEATLAEQVPATSADPEIVHFRSNDLLKPLQWSTRRKWIIVTLVTLTLSVDVFATLTIVSAAAGALKDFGISNDFYYVLLVSIWEIGEGIGSLLSGPLSEMLGRVPVYHAGNICFCLCLVACALSPNISTLVAFRFLAGFTTTALALGPAIIGDMFIPEERGFPMAINLMLPSVLSAIAPIAGGYVAQTRGWRWSNWIVVFPAGALTVASFIYMRETYEPILLKRKAAKISGASRNVASSTDTRRIAFQGTFRTFSRPARMMLFSRAVLIVSVYTAVGYGILYVILTTLSLLMRRQYGFSQGEVGASYLANAIGGIVGTLCYALLSDRLLARLATNRPTKPEHRLLFLLAGSVLLPLGIFCYGWTAKSHSPWIIPLLGTSVIGFSYSFILIAAENYLVDAYGEYSSSAVSAGVSVRAMSGTFFPLAAPPLYARLGYGWGNSVFGFICCAFIPLAAFITIKGEFVRNRDRFRQ